jgi:hypothetical protein
MKKCKWNKKRKYKRKDKQNYEGINTNGMTHRERARPRATKSDQIRPIASNEARPMSDTERDQKRQRETKRHTEREIQ